MDDWYSTMVERCLDPGVEKWLLHHNEAEE